MADDLTPAGHAGQIEAARGRLIEFARRRTDAEWSAAPIDGDPRPVGVIVDHVADAQQYLAGWIGDIVAGRAVDVNGGGGDELNAEHAATVGLPTQAHVTNHLQASGDALIALVSGLEPGQLALGDGRVGRLAAIAARHADGHRTEIEAALDAAARPAS